MAQENLVRLQCTECKQYNYHTRRNLRRQDGHKLELKKFCPHDRKHTKHVEKAKK